MKSGLYFGKNGLCNRLYERHIQIQNEIYFQTSLPLYRGLKKLAEQHRPLWIFSLNHDLCIEMIASEFEIRLKTGFPHSDLMQVPRKDETGDIIRHLTFLHLSREHINAKQLDFIQPGNPRINLAKLHGSLDVFAYGDELNYVKLSPDSKGIKGWVEALQALNMEVYGYKLHDRPFHPLHDIAFTDVEGEIQFLRKALVAGGHKFERQVGLYAMPELLEFFKQKLDEFDVLTAIGYGFGDEHINDIIVKWLGLRSGRELCIVAPSRTRSGLPDSFKDLDNQIEIVNEYATDFLDRLSGNTLSEEERCLKDYKRSFRKFQQANREIAEEMHDAIQRRSFKDYAVAFMKIYQRDPELAKQMMESLLEKIRDLSR